MNAPNSNETYAVKEPLLWGWVANLIFLPVLQVESPGVTPAASRVARVAEHFNMKPSCRRPFAGGGRRRKEKAGPSLRSG
jgi:hypothetical protein